MGKFFHLRVEEGGKRLDLFLSQKLGITRTKAKRLIQDGLVHMENQKVKPSLLVRPGFEILVTLEDEEPPFFLAEDIPLQVIYEDEFMIAVNKPKGMVVHPSCGHKKGTLLNALLHHIGMERASDPRIGIVHRLDKDTTGVILLAKNEKVQAVLSSLFKERLVNKVYRAIVHGIIREQEGTIEQPLGRDPRSRKKMAVLKEGGRYAKTRFSVLERLKRYTYLEVYPETGRTHQIRVHLSWLGHPIVGDRQYGRRDSVERPLLHAFSLSFVHPIKCIPLELKAPLPNDMEDFLEASRLS